jgi:hypothetical protein
VRAQARLGDPVSDQPPQQVRDLPEQALVRRGVASALGAHCFGPEMFARLHIFLFVGTAGNAQTPRFIRAGPRRSRLGEHVAPRDDRPKR